MTFSPLRHPSLGLAPAHLGCGGAPALDPATIDGFRTWISEGANDN